MCGVFGVFDDDRAAALTKLGLHALQDRGQESAGIASSDGLNLFTEVGMGLVHEVFPNTKQFHLPGKIAIGHVRYSTAGGSIIQAAQPMLVDGRRGKIAIVHNGNLPHADVVRTRFVNEGAIFRSKSDTEVVLHCIARSRRDSLVDAIIETFEQDDMDGAYSMVLLTNRNIIAIRDPRGFRPLSIGRLESGGWVVASETAALDLIDARFVRDVDPGEVIVFNPQGPVTVHRLGIKPRAHCIFEHVYFSKPNSIVFGGSVNESRHKAGKALAREHPCAGVDFVVPVPDSGVVAAVGFAQESGLALRPTGLVRSHHIGRTFIEPDHGIRDLMVKLKHSPTRHLLNGKKIVLVDDSIVRGNTLRQIVRMVKSAGTREVHVRIACPPTIASCYYGVDTPNRSELVAADSTVEATRCDIGADSLGYLSLDGLIQACQNSEQPLNWCTACYSNVYPLEMRKGDLTKAEREMR